MRRTDAQSIRYEEGEFNIRLGAALRRQRRRLGYSIDAVGAALDMSAQTVSRYELGETPIAAGRLWSLSRTLHLAPALAVAEASLRGDSKDRFRDTGAFDAGLYELMRWFLRLQTPSARRLACEAIREIADSAEWGSDASRTGAYHNLRHF